MALPDSLLTQWGLVSSPACALTLAFRQVVRLGASWPFIVHMSVPAHITARCSISLSLVFALVIFQFSDGRTAELCGSLTAPHGGITLTARVLRSQLYTPTVTSWCELPVPCVDIGLHTRVYWHSVPGVRVLPTGYTQCYQSTSSGKLHSVRHKQCNASHAC